MSSNTTCRTGSTETKWLTPIPQLRIASHLDLPNLSLAPSFGLPLASNPTSSYNAPINDSHRGPVVNKSCTPSVLFTYVRLLSSTLWHLFSSHLVTPCLRSCISRMFTVLPSYLLFNPNGDFEPLPETCRNIVLVILPTF